MLINKYRGPCVQASGLRPQASGAAAANAVIWAQGYKSSDTANIHHPPMPSRVSGFGSPSAPAPVLASDPLHLPSTQSPPSAAACASVSLRSMSRLPRPAATSTTLPTPIASLEHCATGMEPTVNGRGLCPFHDLHLFFEPKPQYAPPEALSDVAKAR